MKKGILISLFILILGVAIYYTFNAIPVSKEPDSTDLPTDIYEKNGQIVEKKEFTEKDDFIKLQDLDSNYKKIYDYGKGFTMKYYKGMDVDTSLSEVKTTMLDDNIIIEIYHDDFKNTQTSYEAYRNYSNKFLENTKDHTKEYEKNIKINKREAHILQWNRKKLKNVKNDKNYYLSVEIKGDDKEVYTIFMKSSKPFETEGESSYMNIVESFNLIDKKATSKINTTFKKNNRKFNKETEEVYKKYFLDSDKLRWGIFEYSAPADMSILNQFEERMDYDFEFLVKYDFFSSPEIVPMGELEAAYENGKIMELTFQTTHDDKDNSSGMYEILDGKYDDYFTQYAKNLKKFNHPVLFRLNNEMNGDWCDYSSYHFSKDTDIFKEVWKHVYNIFEDNSVDNVLWVWNPHDISFPKFNWNHYLNYYPGDEYVDIVGLTGYNTGTYYKGEVWRDFKEVYDDLYEEYANYFEQPLMITEFSGSSIGGDKIAWINEMFDNMKKYDKIKVAIWWNGIDWDTNKKPARIYRLDESEEMLDTFKERLKEYK